MIGRIWVSDIVHLHLLQDVIFAWNDAPRSLWGIVSLSSALCHVAISVVSARGFVQGHWNVNAESPHQYKGEGRGKSL
jgi:hypothetical protein